MSVSICTGQVPAVTNTLFICDVKNESNLLDKTWFYFDFSISLSLQEILKKTIIRVKDGLTLYIQDNVTGMILKN